MFCRNVMIYFDKPTQYDILKRLRAAAQAGRVAVCRTLQLPLHAADIFPVAGADGL